MFPSLSTFLWPPLFKISKLNSSAYCGKSQKGPSQGLKFHGSLSREMSVPSKLLVFPARYLSIQNHGPVSSALGHLASIPKALLVQEGCTYQM